MHNGAYSRYVSQEQLPLRPWRDGTENLIPPCKPLDLIDQDKTGFGGIHEDTFRENRWPVTLPRDAASRADLNLRAAIIETHEFGASRTERAYRPIVAASTAQAPQTT